MKRKYNSMNKIKFTAISEKYAVSNIVKGKLSSAHAMLITYVVKHFKNTRKFKQDVVDALNLLTYAVYTDDPLLLNWSTKQPFSTMPDGISSELIEETLGELFLDIDSIEWDVDPVFSDDTSDVPEPVSSNIVGGDRFEPPVPVSNVKPLEVRTHVEAKKVSTPSALVKTYKTEKEDLYIQSPVIPQFNYSSKWMTGYVDGEEFTIYSTLPEIPTKQNEISCTTDVTKMTDSELLNLYPDHFIRTRAPVMYESCEGLTLHPTLGLLLPIKNYAEEQLIQNLIQYPHLFKLLRKVDNDAYNFYLHIEIDGKLCGILDVWDDLPDTKFIPKQREFVKEYVVRRYLLERDIDHIEHKYPLLGKLDPFLTLSMPSSKYTELGYPDSISLAKQCVVSRVNYKISRNPMVRRLENA